MVAQLFPAAMAFVAVLAVAYALMALADRRQPAVVRRRLDDHAVAVAAIEARRIERIKVLKGETYSTVPALNALLARLRPARTAAVDLVQARGKLSVTQYLLLRLGLGGAALLAAWVGTGLPILGAVAGAVGLLLPRLVLRLRARRIRSRFEAQLAESIDLLVGSLRSGHGFLQGIESVARDVEEPMSGELRQVIEEVNLGTGPVEALQAINVRIPSPDFGLLSTAVAVQRSVGGNLAEVLESISATVRERRRVRGEVHALTTGPRVSSYVLAMIPVGLFAFFAATNTEYRNVMLHSPMGRLMLGFAMVWSLIGFFFTSRVAKVEY